MADPVTAPQFSVVVPVHDPPEDVLRATLDSVLDQTLTEWQLCLVDDGSTAGHVWPMLEQAARQDPRIDAARRPTSGGIVAASNEALGMAAGDFLVLLDHDDLLHPEALERVSRALVDSPDADYVYSDEDKIGPDGRHYDAFLKPGWSPERLRTQMYTCHLSVLRRAVVEEVGGFRTEFEGSQDWDLVLRVVERARRVVHVAEILYHWRALPSSTASAPTGIKDYAFERGRLAVEAHCERIGMQARVERDAASPGVLHLRPALTESPFVSIIVPTRGSLRDVRGELSVLVERCVSSVVAASTYDQVEIIIVVDTSTPASTLQQLRKAGGPALKIVRFDRPFNFSHKINLGAAYARGEHLVLLNDDIEVIAPDWIESMLMYSLLPDVGAVGAKLLFEDGRVQHAGVGFDCGGPGHLFRGVHQSYRGYFDQLLVVANYLAVTGACMMTRRAVFEEVGGLSPTLPVNFGDIDYCLKIHKSGRRVVFDPEAVMYHFESSTRDAVVHENEVALLRGRWETFWGADPYLPRIAGSTSSGFAAPISWSSTGDERP